MQTVVTVPGVARVATSADPLVEVRMLGADQLVLTGLQPGKGQLKLWLKSGELSTLDVEVSGPQVKAQSADVLNIALKVGGARLMMVPGVKRVAIGDPGICDVTTRPNSGLELNDISKGRTSAAPHLRHSPAAKRLRSTASPVLSCWACRLLGVRGAASAFRPRGVGCQRRLSAAPNTARRRSRGARRGTRCCAAKTARAATMWR